MAGKCDKYKDELLDAIANAYIELDRPDPSVTRTVLPSYIKRSTPVRDYSRTPAKDEKIIDAVMPIIEKWNICECEAKTQGLNSRISELMKYTETLQKGYRLPEHWAEFHGKLPVLSKVVEIYQELDTAAEDGFSTDDILGYTKTNLHNLTLSSLSPMGNKKDVVKFDPLLHQTMGVPMISDEKAIIVSPGWRCEDPAGREVIVAKAKVKKE